MKALPTSRHLLLSSLIIAALTGCDRSSPPPAPVSKSAASEATPPKQPAEAAAKAPETSSPALSPVIPPDVTANPPFTLASLQADFDVLSWQTFVAMNWPVLPDGQPDVSQKPGQQKDNNTVWETWRESSTIFLPGGAAPAPWGTASAPPSSLPKECQDLLRSGVRLLTQVGKTPGILTEATQPFNTGPLIDQNGRYAHFEILVNQSMFDTIFTQKLYSKQAQQSAKSVVFECGDPKTNKVGAIMAKAAWKYLSASEIESGRFHAVKAVIYTPPSQDPVIEEKWEAATVGLVGLHIVHKTAGSPQWVWSTFEQVDNCPTDGQSATHPSYNFYNKNAPAAAINTPPKRPWNPNVIEPADRRPQIMRMLPIDEPTQKLNSSWQAALKAVNENSVWQYYELVSTQWPTQPAKKCDVEASAPANVSGSPAPQFLGNTTLESYIQGKVPNVSSSCIECHLNATTTSAAFSDFTYLLQRAQ